jgi:hypothetical protein
MKLNTEDYEILISEFEDAEITDSGCSVALCKIGQTGLFQYDGTLKLNTIFEDVDVYDIDGSEFFIVKGDVKKDKIDPKIKESRKDWYVTSNENVID